MPGRRRPAAAFTHLDAAGAARMVDVGAKAVTARSATASAAVLAPARVLRAIRAQAVAKGDVLAVARIAGIQGAKRCADLVPLCHPLPLDGVAVDLACGRDRVRIRATVRCTGRTGVEMEALAAVPPPPSPSTTCARPWTRAWRSPPCAWRPRPAGGAAAGAGRRPAERADRVGGCRFAAPC